MDSIVATRSPDAISAVDLQKAWYILSLLHQTGGPLPLYSLSSLCILFPAPPDHVSHLCEIPNSPISLTIDLLVAPSVVGFRAFCDYVSNFGVSVPRFGVRGFGDVVTYFRCRKRAESGLKRRLVLRELDENEDNQHLTVSTSGPSSDCTKSKWNTEMCMLYTEQIEQTIPERKSIMWRKSELRDTCFEEEKRFYSNNAEVVKDETVDNSKAQKALSEITIDTTFNAITCIELEEKYRAPSVAADPVSHAFQFENAKIAKKETFDSCKAEKPLVETLGYEREYAYPSPRKRIRQSFDEGNIATVRVDDNNSLSKNKRSFHHNQPSKNSARAKSSKVKALKQEAQCDISGKNRENKFVSGEMQCPRDENTIPANEKSKRKREGGILSKRENDKSKEDREKPTGSVLKNQLEPKSLPNFELYTVEKEEGSGGYGTVYRARRKSDGVIFAIKCPHKNSNNRNHFVNELKMLERFGGKNSVIKYEGSFKSDGSECLVLEHIQHDRPETLKTEIEVSQLMWYGYWMFRALAALHKKGIVHRDVKPGNFLFSREANLGFLIDFNLATDLHQKYGTSNKLKEGYNVNSNRVQSVHAKVLPLANKKFLVNKSTESTSKNLVKNFKPHFSHNIQKKNAVGAKSAFSGQGADGSGVTSAKDSTSTKIEQGQKSKELKFLHGSLNPRLVAFAHQSRQIPNYEEQIVPAFNKRKRVSAPRKVENKNVRITPMPLFSNGVEVAGSGQIKDEGERKQNREGPCVGTKGFRAPEVLFRSAHQGPKIDVWSAGVTLLYMVIGRIPFNGDPEQNIKDIATLRGSEDLWEVAKLHNRISSFPQELHDIQSLRPKELRDWCKKITRRQDFLKEIPKSLFDLVDNCLAVNPRLRLSAEEAFKHEFFATCHVDLQRKWPQKEQYSGSETSQLLQKETLESFQYNKFPLGDEYMKGANAMVTEQS